MIISSASSVPEIIEADTETESVIDNDDEERESYVLTLSQNVENVEEDNSKINEDDISSCLNFEECSQV
jgi:hypothetical protein